MEDISQVWEELAQEGGRIVYLVVDGGGGLPHPETGRSAYQGAEKPNLDALAADSATGLLEMVGPGITPGSGPGHLALFGYEPLRFRLGRGALSALGIGFDLHEGDVAARVNFACSEGGVVVDRRAGRLPTDINRRLCAKLREQVRLDFDGEWFFETESEHRAAFILRGPNLGGRLGDTDPQSTGKTPLDPSPIDDPSANTAAVVRQFLRQAHEVLADEPANTLLLRGFERYKPFPSLHARFGIRGLCLAQYPMYRGLSRLLGMEVDPVTTGLPAMFDALEQRFGDPYDLFFLHVKATDKAGEDGDWHAKVAAIEEMDRQIPRLREVGADVLVVASDHSTPALMAAHSWHPVPALIHSRFARVDPVDRFDEIACIGGSLGMRPALHLLGLAMAHAGRLKKFGA